MFLTSPTLSLIYQMQSYQAYWSLCKIQLEMEIHFNWQRAFEDRREEAWTRKHTLQAKAERTKKGDWMAEKDISLVTQYILWLKVRSNCKIISSSFRCQNWLQTHRDSPKDLFLITLFLFSVSFFLLMLYGEATITISQSQNSNQSVIHGES